MLGKSLVVLEVEVTDLVEELETLAEGLDHFLASFALLHSEGVFAKKSRQIDIVIVESGNELTLHHVFGLVDEEGHDGLGDHVVHGLAHRVEVRHDEALDNVSFELRARRALARIVIGGMQLVWHFGKVNRPDVFLPVLLDLIIVEVLQTAMVNKLHGSITILVGLSEQT